MEPRLLPLTEQAPPGGPGPYVRASSPLAEIGRRLCRLWWLKASGTSLFTYAFFLAYLELLHRPLFPVFEMPLTWVDRQLGFQPWALAAYASLWIYVSLPAALAADRERLFSVGWHMGALCVSGLLFFVFWPTAVPPAAVDWGLYPGYALLKGIDRGGNACPSLHVATALYAALWLMVELRELRCGKAWHAVNWGWCALIAFSTLVTKQHVMLDVLAGGGLALVVAFFSPGLRGLRAGKWPWGGRVGGEAGRIGV